LRERGLEIETFAIRRSGRDQILDLADREAAETTTVLLPASVARLLECNIRLLARNRSAYKETLLRALSLGRGARGRLWQGFYFAEAVLLARACAEMRVDHLHAHFGNPSGDVALLAARLLGVPWSLTFHGTDVNRGERSRLAAKVREAAFVVCVGHFARDRLLPLVEPSQWPKIRVVRCGLDARWFAPPERVAAPNGAVRLLSVARLEPPKDPETLLEAVAKLRRRGRQVELTLVGDGPLRPRLERRARQLGLSSHVVFAGFIGQDGLHCYYRNADLFCLSSVSEGVPVVLMEAMAQGVPLVAPRLPGVQELVQDGREGVLVPPMDAVALAEAIDRLASAPLLAERLVRAGRRKVEAEFRLERSAAELERLFRTAWGPSR
jgi:colanic acid/amylovoran biosynthesis glycosyltransferase